MEDDVTLKLTRREAEDLLSLLNDDLPELEREVARTEFNRRFRRFLGHRRDNIEHVRNQLAVECGEIHKTE